MNLDAEIKNLQAAQLIKADDSGEPSLSFRHVLTQETAYASLLLSRRRELHAKVARAYERLYPSRLDDLAPLLARHYREAVDYSRTLEYATRAGDRAARTYSHAEALEYYTMALDAAGQAGAPNEEWNRLYRSRGRVMELSSRYEQALVNYEQMGFRAAGLGDRSGELAALMARAQLYVIPSAVQDTARGQQLLDHALGVAAELEDRAAEARIYWLLMILGQWTSQIRMGIEYGEKSIALSRQYGLREQLAYSLNDIAQHGYSEVGELARDRECAEEALGLWEELENLPMLADSLGNLAVLEAAEGRFEEVISLGNRMREIARRTGNLWTESYSHFAEGDAYGAWGDAGRAMEVMEECISLGARAGFRIPDIWVRSSEAWLNAEMGNLPTAFEQARKASQAGEMFQGTYRAWPYAVLVRVDLLEGNVQTALSDWQASGLDAEVDVFADAAPSRMCGIALARGELALALQDTAKARRVADKLVRRLEEIGARTWLPQALLFQARVLPAEDNSARWQALEKARVTAEEIEARLYLWRILAEEGDLQELQGNAAEASALRERALAIVNYIADRAPIGLKETFLNIPPVVRLRQNSKVDIP